MLETKVLLLICIGLCFSSSRAQYDLNAGKECALGWQLAVRTTATGSVAEGSKSNLVNAVRQGARVRVFVSAWGSGGYSAEADNIHIMPNNADVCIQLLQAVSKNGFDKFQDNAYWWWVYLCSSAHVHMTRYNVGASTFRGDTKTKVGASWFVKYPGPSRVAYYQNNATGARIGGALFSLADSIADNGADIRGISGNSYCFSMQNIHAPIDGSFVSGQSLNHVSATSSGNVATFQSNAYWWFTTVSTDGTRDMSRWTVGEHIDRDHTSDKESFTWFADRCWKLVYTSGENGEAKFGTRQDLINEIRAGKRVRVMTQDKTSHSMYITEADFIWVRNGHVTVQNLGNVSKADPKLFQNNAYWYWQMKSTTGRVTDTRYNVGENKARGITTSKMEINWYVETRPMKMALSHRSDGTVIGGSRSELVTAIKRGASVQIVTQDNQDAYSSFPAHNLALRVSGAGAVAAQNVKHVSVQSASGNQFEYEIQSNPYWWFSIVTTEGKLDMIRYTVGTHNPRGHNQDRVALKWFVNV